MATDNVALSYGYHLAYILQYSLMRLPLTKRSLLGTLILMLMGSGHLASADDLVTCREKRDGCGMREL